jgi:hypothetical protein
VASVVYIYISWLLTTWIIIHYYKERHPYHSVLSSPSLDSNVNTRPTIHPLSHNPRPHRPCCPRLQPSPSRSESNPTLRKLQSDFVSLRSAKSKRLSNLFDQFSVVLQTRSNTDFCTISGGLSRLSFQFGLSHIHCLPEAHCSRPK